MRLLILAAGLLLFAVGGCKPDGGDEPVAPAPDCAGKIKKIEKGGVTTFEKGSCSGQCADGTECTWKKSTDHHGATREWCGCGDSEPTQGCYLVLYTSPSGETEAVCPPKDCPDGGYCKLGEGASGEVDGVKTTEMTCGCD